MDNNYGDSQLKSVHRAGALVLTWMQDIGLLIIAVATVVAIGDEIALMVSMGKVRLADLLLLFIYLEIITMVAVYLKSGKLPVRIPLYIAIVALARYLILDMKSMDWLQMVGVAVATLIIAITILVIRFGHVRFPYGREEG